MKQRRSRISVLFLVLFAGGAFAPEASIAADCSPAAITGKLIYHADPREPLNRGVVTDKFLAPPGDRVVLHGVDASKYQDLVDFEEVRRCGGSFAFIRLSAGTAPNNELLYRDLWNNARSVGLLTGGYHNFTMNIPSGPLSRLSPAEFAALVEKNNQRATDQADLYLARLDELRDLEIVSGTRKRAFSFLPPVLDLSWKPDPKAASNAPSLLINMYQAAVCKWVDRITATKEFSIGRVILFVSAATYHDMAIARLPCIDRVAGLWISDRTPDGGVPAYLQSKTGNAESTLCALEKLPCLFQQYTSHGKFAVFGKQRSIDLNRFFGTEADLQKLLTEAQ